jgi:hypothetical protein
MRHLAPSDWRCLWRKFLQTWTSRTAIDARIAEERRNPVESWNELTAAREDNDLSFDKVEYEIKPAKWPWLVHII